MFELINWLNGILCDASLHKTTINIFRAYLKHISSGVASITYAHAAVIVF